MLLKLVIAIIVGIILQYVYTKIKNLATKQDIAKITKKEEEVRAAISLRNERYSFEMDLLWKLMGYLVDLKVLIESLSSFGHKKHESAISNEEKELLEQARILFSETSKFIDHSTPFLPKEIADLSSELYSILEMQIRQYWIVKYTAAENYKEEMDKIYKNNATILEKYKSLTDKDSGEITKRIRAREAGL